MPTDGFSNKSCRAESKNWGCRAIRRADYTVSICHGSLSQIIHPPNLIFSASCLHSLPITGTCQIWHPPCWPLSTPDKHTIDCTLHFVHRGSYDCYVLVHFPSQTSRIQIQGIKKKPKTLKILGVFARLLSSAGAVVVMMVMPKRISSPMRLKVPPK